MRHLKRLYWHLYEVAVYLPRLVKGPHRRYAASQIACGLGLHYPVTFWEAAGGYSSPPEFCWACEKCGMERLPYRSPLWRVPLLRRVVR